LFPEALRDQPCFSEVDKEYGAVFFKEHTRDNHATWTFSRVAVESMHRNKMTHMLTTEIDKVISMINHRFRKEFIAPFDQITKEGWNLMHITSDTTPRGRNDFMLHFERAKDFHASTSAPFSPLVAHPVVEETVEEQLEVAPPQHQAPHHPAEAAQAAAGAVGIPG